MNRHWWIVRKMVDRALAKLGYANILALQHVCLEVTGIGNPILGEGYSNMQWYHNYAHFKNH